MRKVIFCGKAEEGCGVNAAYFGGEKEKRFSNLSEITVAGTLPSLQKMKGIREIIGRQRQQRGRVDVACRRQLS
jgi:hypothetical protein